MKEQIEKACEILKAGGIILYPTDTVWGIGCDATNAAAVEKIYKLKKSADKKGMLILVDSVSNATRYSSAAPQIAWELLEASDKPMTLVLPGACGVAENLIPDEGTIALRIPDHEFCHALLRRFRKPLVSTSANMSGSPTPSDFDSICDQIVQGVDFVCDKQYEGGSTGKPSSIISLGAGGEVKIIRE